MSTTPSSTSLRAPDGRALVLGGGGSTGNAWLIGVVAGLFDAGLDVTAADVTIGTSAGATAAAQLSGSTPPELLAGILSPAPQGSTGPARPGRRAPSTSGAAAHLDRITSIIAAADDPTDLRRRLGAAALDMEAASDGSWQSQWRQTVAARLPSPLWPRRTILLTAVDAQTGEPAVFDRHSGADLVDAVAASCASSLPYRIGGRPYIDGGYRSNADNADLAAGCARVLVLSPLGGRSLHPVGWGTHLATQVDKLRAHGITVETVFPDGSAESLFGSNAMNPSLRPAAARSGYNQGTALVGQLAALWR